MHNVCEVEKEGWKVTGSPDRLFKTFLTHTDTDRKFLALHQPAKLQQLCDLTILQLESGSYIKEILRIYFADVLYFLKTTDGEEYLSARAVQTGIWYSDSCGYRQFRKYRLHGRHSKRHVRLRRISKWQ